MSRVRQLPGGGRGVEVPSVRLEKWFAGFAERHDGVAWTRIDPRRIEVSAGDGSTAAVVPPFGPLPAPPGTHEGLVLRPLAEHLRVPRWIGIVLVRAGAHSVGVAHNGVIERSNTDRNLLQGRSKAGGWSQKRFARRRQGQSRKASESAADAIARVLVPVRDRLDAVVLGGDKQALVALRKDTRIGDLLAMAEPRILDVPEPRRAVLDSAAERATAVEIEVREP